MTLRLRLTLFYTLLVTLVPGVSGLGLYLLLRQSLYLGLDRSLEETADLLSNFMEREDGVLEFDIEEDGFPRLPTGLVALLTGPEGERLDNLGRVPGELPAPSVVARLARLRGTAVRGVAGGVARRRVRDGQP